MSGCDRFDQLMRGVCPVLEVPFDAEGSLDHEGFDRLVAHVLGTGVTAVVCPAFASEFYKLSDEEKTSLRRQMLGHTRRHQGALAVTGITQHATRLAVLEAVAAVEDGADALNVLPPFFLGPPKEEVRQHLRAVLRAVRPTPVIVQHAPGLAASALTPGDLCALAAEHPNLRMVKVEAVPPGRFISALSAATPALPAMVGYAGVMMIDGLRRGAVGVQPGCSAVEVYQSIWRLWANGEHEASEALHRRLLPFVSYWAQEVELVIQVEKTISRERGIITTDHCRDPGRPLDAEEKESVMRFLSEFAEILEEKPSRSASLAPAWPVS